MQPPRECQASTAVFPVWAIKWRRPARWMAGREDGQAFSPKPGVYKVIPVPVRSDWTILAVDGRNNVRLPTPRPQPPYRVVVAARSPYAQLLRQLPDIHHLCTPLPCVMSHIPSLSLSHLIGIPFAPPRADMHTRTAAKQHVEHALPLEIAHAAHPRLSAQESRNARIACRIGAHIGTRNRSCRGRHRDRVRHVVAMPRA